MPVLKLPDVGVPNIGVTNDGLVDKTTEPVPVDVVTPVPPFKTASVPANVIVPLLVIGPPLVVSPVEPPEAADQMGQHYPHLLKHRPQRDLVETVPSVLAVDDKVIAVDDVLRSDFHA